MILITKTSDQTRQSVCVRVCVCFFPLCILVYDFTIIQIYMFIYLFFPPHIIFYFINIFNSLHERRRQDGACGL